MRTLALIGIAAAILGCQSSTRRVLTLRNSSETTTEARAERKGDEIHVTIPRQDSVVDAAPPSMLGLFDGQSSNYGGYSPARTYRAVGMGWARLPLPYPKIHSIPVAPQAMVAPQVYAPPAYAAGIQPIAGYQQPQNQQSALLQKLLTEIEGEKRAAAETKKSNALQDRANELEKRVDQLIEQLKKKPSGSESASTSTDADSRGSSSTRPVSATSAADQGRANVRQAVETRAATTTPGPGLSGTSHNAGQHTRQHSNLGQRDSFVNHESSFQTPALTPAKRSQSNIEMWPYRPANVTN